MMSKVVTTNERNPFIQNGILCVKDVPLIFNDDIFHWKYFDHYLAILDRFGIALPVNNIHVLIPSMLSDDRPRMLLESFFSDCTPVYSRYVRFNSEDALPGFWSVLLSRIIHSIPTLDHDESTHSILTEKGDMSNHGVRERDTASAITISSPASNPEVNQLGTSSIPPPPDNNQHEVASKPLATAVQLKYWRSGLHYKDPQVMFCIESLAKSTCTQEEKDGVLFIASLSNQGKKMIGQMVDIVLSLINQYYPGLTAEGNRTSNTLEQRVPCLECIKAKRSKPFEFCVSQCLPIIVKNQTTIKCGYYTEDHAKNHTVSLADVVPDLLLQDILLNHDDIHYKEDSLGMGKYGKINRGTCQKRVVAIKKYTSSEEAFTELWRESMQLQQLRHPCLVSLVGVCTNPMAIIMDDAPLIPLFPVLKRKIPIHRLTIFRIAAEVAAALRFLHSQGIIFCNFSASNVMLWTLDPASLCHCKVTDFCTAAQKVSMAAQGLHGTKGFFAPEVLHIGKRKQCNVYDHTVDIFSFGMFLYQMIARRNPYHDIPAHKIDASVEMGERPKLQDVHVATTGYHYLSMLMKKCWEDRPGMNTIIKAVSMASMQSVMCVFPVESTLTLCNAIALTQTDLTKAITMDNELWVCCDGTEGAELSIYNSHTMKQVSKNFIKKSLVCCVALSKDNVWVGSRDGNKNSSIDIFNIVSRERVHKISLRKMSVSCLTATKDCVLIGTLEGYISSFSNDVVKVREVAKPFFKFVSEDAISGIASTSQFIWVSHTRYIHFINLQDLAHEGSISHDKERSEGSISDDNEGGEGSISHSKEGGEGSLSHSNEGGVFIGQMSVSPAEDIIWSAHLGGGSILTAWDVNSRMRAFDVDTSKVLHRITGNLKDDWFITAMTPVLDTVWVGMATGHILLFHMEDLLTWYRPYVEFVRFLTVIPGSGPCGMEKCMVVSGGKGFRPLIGNMGSDYEETDDKGEPHDRAGVLVVWEAYEAKTMQQIKLVEENAPGHLDSFGSVRQMIHDGEFKDGTCVSETEQDKEGCKEGSEENSPAETTSYAPDQAVQVNQNPFSMSFPENTQSMLTVATGGTQSIDNLQLHSTNFSAENKGRSTDVSMTGLAMAKGTPKITGITTASPSKEVFEILLPDSSQIVLVSCPKPPSLKVLLSELQNNTPFRDSKYHVEYTMSSGESVKLQSQEQLDCYIALPERPQLVIPLIRTN